MGLVSLTAVMIIRGMAAIAYPGAATQRSVVDARICPGLIADFQQLSQLRVHSLRRHKKCISGIW